MSESCTPHPIADLRFTSPQIDIPEFGPEPRYGEIAMLHATDLFNATDGYGTIHR